MSVSMFVSLFVGEKENVKDKRPIGRRFAFDTCKNPIQTRPTFLPMNSRQLATCCSVYIQLEATPLL